MINDHIAGLRKRIDEIDGQLLDLLNRRMDIAIHINHEKKKTAAPVYYPSREAFILSRLTRLNRGPLKNDLIRHIFREILSASRALTAPQRISFLGPDGSFSHQAALIEFGSASPLAPAKDIPEIFSEVEYGTCDFGVVPIENSINGTVPQTLDLLTDTGLLIAREVFVPVSYTLAARRGVRLNSVRRVYAHPQAAAQCRRWLREHLPNATIVDTDSNSRSATLVRTKANAAAITTGLAAELYRLGTIAEKLEENPRNVTRFVVMGRIMPDSTDDNKTSVLFAVKDRAGALYSALKPFSEHRVNLTKIESRPSKKKAWEYLFFVDIDGHVEDPKIRKAIAALKTHTVFFKFLGSYPKTRQEIL